jgi:GT2 family glycosyltransferase
VDTVPFGAFQRSWVDRIGDFDESLLTNEDYEYNVRIRQAGGEIYFDPDIRSIYFARRDINSLAHQYWRYGYWKAVMLRRNPYSVRLRQVIPPTFVLFLVALGILSIAIEWARCLLALEIAAYFMVVLFAALVEFIQRKDVSLMLSFPLALTTMHFSWGSGFLWNFLRGMLGNRRGR